MNTDLTISDLVAQLHQGPTKICLVTTGAGAGCQALLAGVPGASNTLLESHMPYDRHALADFMLRPKEQFRVTSDTALAMAAQAWRRAHQLCMRRGEDPSHAVGVAATGVIATGRTTRGKLRLHLAARTATGFLAADVFFAKSQEDSSLLGREREAAISDAMTLNMALHVAGIYQVVVPCDHLSGDLRPWCAGNVCRILEPRNVVPNVPKVQLSPEEHVLFDGSFNPWHHGHEAIAREVELRTGKRVVHVITDDHPNKGLVEKDDLAARVSQFQLLAPVIVVQKVRLYVDKARAHPGFSRIIGADTLRRVLDPTYGVPTLEVLRSLQSSGAHFFVANRPHGKDAAFFGEVVRDVPAEYLRLFTELSTVVDASSTAARAADGKP